MKEGDKVTIGKGTDIWIINDMNYSPRRWYCTHEVSGMGADLYADFLRPLDSGVLSEDQKP